MTIRLTKEGYDIMDGNSVVMASCKDYDTANMIYLALEIADECKQFADEHTNPFDGQRCFTSSDCLEFMDNKYAKFKLFSKGRNKI